MSDSNMQTDTGKLQVKITTINNIPIENANISIYYTGEPDRKLEEIRTNGNGQSEVVDLSAPPVELSLHENNIIQPYSEYTILAEADGFVPVDISAFHTTGFQDPGHPPGQRCQPPRRP